MPNLNLTHSGNMNITSASIGSGGTLNVQYEPNTTGAITGWTHNQPDPLVCGETYTILLYPQFSGTVLTENFTVSGVDVAGVNRSDTSVLRQGFNKDLRDYLAQIWAQNNRLAINSSSATENYVEVNATVVSPSPFGNYVDLNVIWDNSDSTHRSQTIRFNVDTGSGPDTGTVASSLTLVVADTITDYGQASAIYSPSNAYVDLHYVCVNLDGSAVIDPVTGEITVQSTGTVYILVGDDISRLSDYKTINVIKSDEPGPDTGDTGVTALTISVADEIIENGIAVPIFSPSTAETSFVFTSSDDSIATIDSGGNITVLDNGLVTFCVEETISGLRDCKEVSVRKAVYIDTIEIVVDDMVVLSGIATANYTPSDGTVSLVYTSSDPDKAFINPMTGEITVYESGEVTFCVRDLYTNKSDCKTVNVKGPNDFAQFTYNVTSTSEPTLLFSNDSCCGDHWSDFSEAIYYNGVSITPNTKSYTFPETGEQTIYVEFKTYEDSGRTLLNNCIFRDNTKLVKAKFPADYNVQATGNYTFYGCTNLREADMSCFTELDYACFYGCSSLTSLTIPNLEIIGTSSLSRTGLVTLYGPKVKRIGGTSLDVTTSLKTVNFPVAESYLGWCFCGSTLEEITIASSVTLLENGVFDDCKKLRNITFNGSTPPDGKGPSTFSGCYSLLNTWVPCDAVSAYKTYMPSNTGFGDLRPTVRCRANTPTDDITLVYAINSTESAAKICTYLRGPMVSIKDENGDELYGNYNGGNGGIWMQYDTTGSTTVSITVDLNYVNQNGLGDILQGTGIYATVPVLLKEITIPDTVTNISGFTLAYQVGLTDAYIPSTIQNTSFSDGMFANTQITSLIIPSAITSISNYCFSGCTHLADVTIPNYVTSIGDCAFYGAGDSGLTSQVFVIPDSVRTIGVCAFTSASFTEFEIGTGVRNIGNLAFCRSYSGTYWENGRITKMTIRATTPPTLGQHSIYGGDSSTHYPIYVPSQSLNAYKAANYYLPRTRLYSI